MRVLRTKVQATGAGQIKGGETRVGQVGQEWRRTPTDGTRMGKTTLPCGSRIGKVTPTNGERLRNFFYIPTAGNKIVGNCRCIVANFIND